MRIYNWVSCGFIFLQFFLSANGKEWCKAKFEYGMSDYAECQKEGDNLTKYMIEIIPAKANNIDLYNDVSIVLSNSQGINTKEIMIGSEKEGLFRKVYSVRKDIDNPEYIHVKLNSKINNNRNWKCKKIKVWKEYKYWTFDCIGILNEEKQEATYFLSGNKLYTAYVQTGKDIEAGTTGIIDIILLGNNNKRSNTKMLHEGFTSGGLKKIKFQASDVGNLENIILINNSYNDPWYCDFVKIKSDDNKVYIFNVKSWIGYPYNNKIKININTNNIDGNAKDIDCHIRANDLIDTTKSLNNNFVLQNKVHIFKVRCPQNCHSSDFSIIEGTSIHPASTSICAAAIYDGSLTESGGEIIVTITKGLNHYYAMDDTYNNLKAIDFSTKGDESDENNFSFYTYHLTSIDDIKSNVRIVDSFGKLSSLGRLEIRVNNKWGAVCKKGPNFEFSEDAAKRACKDLGFLNGIYIKENCSNINEQNYCAGYKYPFNASGILCSGNEQNLLSCNTDDPSYCIDHHDDVIIQCVNQLGNDSIENGTIRLLDSTGAPTSNGIGRLQIYYNGVFGSVCSEGWTKETEKIACLELGYHNVKANGFSKQLCNDVAGENLCGHDTERINATNFRCKGDEANLKNCPHETSEDIYCSHEEDIIIGCANAEEEGDASTSSTRISKYGLNKHIMSMEKKQFHPKIELSCFDKISSKAELSKGNVGDIFLVSCPEKCDEDIGVIKGTFVYTFDSYICKAAIHAGVLSSNVADDVVLIITHSRNKFMGTKRNNIESKEFNGESKSFSLSIPTNYIIMEERQNNSKYEDEVLKDDNDFYYEHIFNKQNNNENGKNKTFFEHNMHLEPTFQWIAPSSFTGFNGDENEYINASNLPNEKYIRTLSNFTFITHFIPSSKGKNKWRTILSHSLCEGISISIDEENELVIEQNCNPHLIKTKFIPKFEHPYHLVLIYNKPNKSISLYINQKKINLENMKIDFTLNGDLTIGRSNKQATDYFIGDINFVKIYKYILTEQEIKESYDSVLSNNYLNDGMSGNRDIQSRKIQNKKTKNQRKTIDGRDCITPCKSKTNVNKNIQINTEEFYLNCSDNLLSEKFSGKIGTQFLASCSEDCTSSKYIVKGSNNYYTPDTSICKAVMHSGIIRKSNESNKDENKTNNNSFIIKIVEGLTEYKSSRGHFGIISKAEKQSQLRSFSLFSKKEDDIFTCFTDASFLFELPIGSTKNIICPENCHKVDKQIFGTNTYSPLSSVCKAAIHAGVISTKGGQVQVAVGKGQQEFKPSTQNNVQSYIAEKQDRSFTFLKRLY